MPLPIPTLSDRKYQDLVDEALARIAVHTPEWTNWNDSDPGVTLIQLFAFLTESLLYRSNQIPERNRRKFLTLLGVPLQPSTPAQGLVTFRNERGPFETILLDRSLEVRAGEVPFLTQSALDVLPVDWQVFIKQPVVVSDQKIIEAYRKLYTPYQSQGIVPDLATYRAVPLTSPGAASRQGGVTLATQTMDGALWIALLKRPADQSYSLRDVCRKIGGKTISLGLVPGLTADDEYHARLSRKAAGRSESALTLLRFDIPAGGKLGDDPGREPKYRTLEPITTDNILTEPGIIQLTLPEEDKLRMWDDIDPLEAGVGNMPPALDDTELNDRLITWIRVSLASSTEAAGQAAFKVLWVGLNTARVSQKAHISAEELSPGTGKPDQTVRLSRFPVIRGSVSVMVSRKSGSEQWNEIDDLFAAGPEVPVPDPRLSPGAVPRKPGPSKVFVLIPESGEIMFGDGLRGERPALGARLLAEYDHCLGRRGNVGVGAVNGGPMLPAGFKVSNEVPTWGGADAESVEKGEKQISRYLQHQDRLVTVEDFRTIAGRTPGIELGRVEVLSAYNPLLTPNEPGDAPGAVTLMVVPKYDPVQPDAPEPDRLFLNALCQHLDPKRLVTTEIYLVGPEYVNVWISVGIKVEPGASAASVREAVKAGLRAFLSPLPQDPNSEKTSTTGTPLFGQTNGWPLSTSLLSQQLIAVVDRVPGVSLVNQLYLAKGPSTEDEEKNATLTQTDAIAMKGLQLPRIRGLSVASGDALPLNDLRKQSLGLAITSETGAGVGPAGRKPVLPLPVPVIPEECQ